MKFTSKTYLLITFLLILFAPLSAQKKPNVVVFLVDDLGYMDIGAYNPKSFYKTPNLDKLSNTGMRFTDGYAANPVCSPTRYSLMTGKYPTRIDATNFFTGTRAGKFLPAVLHNNMPLSEVTIAEALKENGYKTFFAGKWHLGPTKTFWPKNQGFDVNKGGFHKGGPYGPGRYFTPYGNPELEDGPKGEHLPIRLAKETNKFMRDNKDKPFFAYLSFYSVHTPLMGPKDLVEEYKAESKKIKGKEFADEEQVHGKRPRKVRVLQKHPIYAAMMESMDKAVGMVLDKLKELDLDDNTIVLMTSDNGGLSTSEGSPTSNMPLRGGKGWIYEGGIREPFLIRWPGVTKPGSVNHTPIISNDLYPTILEATGHKLIPELHKDGRSLVPLLQGEKTLDREALYWHYPHYSNQGGFPGGAVRMGDYKLIERYEDGRVHLYNLKEDIGERKDIARKHPEKVKVLREKLHAWYKDVDAKFLRAKPNQKEQPWRP